MSSDSNAVALDVQCVWDAKATLGESPLYDPRTDCLLWVDIKQSKLYRYNLQNQSKKIWDVPSNVSAIGLHKTGGYIAVNSTGFHTCEINSSDGCEFKSLAPYSLPNGHRFNDGKVDPFGHFWVGTMDDAEVDDRVGDWLRLSPDGQVKTMATGFHVTNGPAFDETRGVVYLTDSPRQTIYSAHYKSGENLGELSIFAKFKDGEGYPDGMTVDADGCLWVAFWDGHCIRKIDPSGKTLLTIKMPVPRPTSVEIAKTNLFITSASVNLTALDNQHAPQSGGLFEVSTDKNSKKSVSYFGVA